jgi:actin-like ATPase involved in cell morphogenesis
MARPGHYAVALYLVMSATSYSIGIDLGTTYSAAAVYRDGAARICLLGGRGAAIPSLVFLRDDQEVLTGEAAERRGAVEPTRLAREFKRRVGDSVPILLGQAPYSAERLMAALLEQVVEAVSTREGSDPAHVAVSHPANWGPFKIDLLRHGLDLAGLRSVSLLSEPVAAAVHYASKERIEAGTVMAVYDLGGGTFDAAVLKKTDGDFVTLGEPEGIERLGGIDFDEAVLAYVRSQIQDRVDDLDGSDPSVRVAMARLRKECVAAKEALSFDSETTIPVALPNVHTDIRLTRAEFEPMVRPAIAETIEALRRAVERAGIRPDDLDTVLLVGGSSQIPLVSELVSNAMGRAVSIDSHPKHSVALGAAVVAARAARDAGVAGLAPSGHAGHAGPDSSPGHVPGLTPAPVAAGDQGPAALANGPAEAPGLGSGMAAGFVANGGNGHGHGDNQPHSGENQPPGTPPRPGAGAGGGASSGDFQAPPSGSGQRPAAGLSRSRLLAAAVAAAVVVAAAGGAYALSSSDKGGDQAGADTTEAPQTTDAPGTTAAPTTAPTTTAPAPPPCESGSGRCARITDISVEGDRYVALYEVEDFEPLRPDHGGSPEDHHLHFFFDTTPPEQAGQNPGPEGQWVLWDRQDGEGELRFVDAHPAEAQELGAEQLCVLVADAGHGVEQGTGNCVDLPT